MGAEINELDSIGQTPLHYAVCHTYALPIVRVLVDKRADLNIQRNADGWTALHLSAMFGKSDVAHCLLEAGADPEIRDTSNKTAEDTAKHYRHHQLADLLSRLYLYTTYGKYFTLKVLFFHLLSLGWLPQIYH